MFFTWDEAKNKKNKNKHGVSFEEAQSVFFDECAKLITDPDHSQEEDHFILMGMSEKLKLLVVVHVYREDDEVIRIISARKAKPRESKNYKR